MNIYPAITLEQVDYFGMASAYMELYIKLNALRKWKLR
jgi:hypothetical protein